MSKFLFPHCPKPEEFGPPTADRVSMSRWAAGATKLQHLQLGSGTSQHADGGGKPAPENRR
ncbi:MAG: hypothetical protein U0872_00390 [Planctomycetaceae bacterium]